MNSIEKIQNSIYVFSLENNKYFVGITTDLPNLLEHLPENEWLKEYKFVEVEEIEKGDYLDGQKILLKYMSLYGIDNVRGMKFEKKLIPRKEYLSLLQQIYRYKDVCEACGSDSHELITCSEEICFVCHKINCKDSHIFSGCSRCGRESHWSFRCNRSKDIYGRNLNNCKLM